MEFRLKYIDLAISRERIAYAEAEDVAAFRAYVESSFGLEVSRAKMETGKIFVEAEQEHSFGEDYAVFKTEISRSGHPALVARRISPKKIAEAAEAYSKAKRALEEANAGEAI